MIEFVTTSNLENSPGIGDTQLVNSRGKIFNSQSGLYMHQEENKKSILLKLSTRGQGLLEFALLVPLLVLIVFGAIDLARAYHAEVTITNASREGARLAMRINNFNDTQANKLQAIRDRVVAEAGTSGVQILPGNVTVNCGIGYAPPCTSGSPIRVTVNYEFTLLMGAYFLPSIDMSHFTEMVTP